MSYIIGYFDAIWVFLINFAESTLTALGLVVNSVVFTLSSVSFLPSILGTAVIVFIAVYLIRFLLMK